MTKFLKIFFIIVSIILVLISALIISFAVITRGATLDTNKLVGAEQNVIIYDDDGNEVVSASLGAQKKSVKIQDLNEQTINAFIASEDRTFYKHNGLNYKRMLKALYKNIASHSFKEGASTISQQLIKNTHLNNDKTIKRKLKEIKLTKQLEKKYEKDDILEMYLNTIYFGHNCYGLQSAAQFYFNKKAEELNLCESATIVGLLISPNNYSPFKNPEKCIKRRNIVLNSMLECKYIDKSTYNDAVNTPLNAVKNAQANSYDCYVNAIFEELDELDFNYYTLADGCIIKTYLNCEAQNFIENIDYPCDNAVIITDNVTGGVKAYKTTIDGAKRQPGSTVKPLFVYAPAIEQKILSPFTKILDEKIDFSGYSPENYDKKYHGYVTVTDSIKNSYNIPAVKTLNSLTIKNSEKYLTAMDLKLDDDEKNLSLALGGMKHGLTIKELTDKYSIFPNKGKYCPSHFIKEIVTKDGKVIYKDEKAYNSVFSEGTCSLMNEMLLQTSKSGTAKKLQDLKFDVASKTGTCGNSEGNTDAYTVSYTSENCIGVWLGDKDNKKSEITGGNDCCKIMKSLLQKLYESHTPQNLDVESGTQKINIDYEEYSKNNKIILSDPLSPKLNVLTVKALKDNIPIEQSSRFSKPTISIPQISVQNGTVNIQLCQTKYYSYLVKRLNNGKTATIYDGIWQETIIDTPDEGVYTYSVTPYFESGSGKYFGEEIVLPSINLTKDRSKIQEQLPDIAHKDWFNK